MELRNSSGNTFTDISTEESRIYEFPDNQFVEILNPLFLSVSESGGHRILDANGYCHYIPAKWIHLKWMVKQDAPHFVK